MSCFFFLFLFLFFQAEDGIRDLVRSRGLGDVYKRQLQGLWAHPGSVVFDLDFTLDSGVRHQRLLSGGRRYARPGRGPRALAGGDRTRSKQQAEQLLSLLPL